MLYGWGVKAGMACLQVKLCVAISERFRKCIGISRHFTDVHVYFYFFYFIPRMTKLLIEIPLYPRLLRCEHRNLSCWYCDAFEASLSKTYQIIQTKLA